MAPGYMIYQDSRVTVSKVLSPQPGYPLVQRLIDNEETLTIILGGKTGYSVPVKNRGDTDGYQGFVFVFVFLWHSYFGRVKPLEQLESVLFFVLFEVNSEQ